MKWCGDWELRRKCGIAVSAVLMFSLCLAAAVLAVEPAPDAAPVQGPPSPFESWTADVPHQPADRVIRATRDWWNDKLVWETGSGRSYVLPVAEILTYEFFLNLFDRNFVEPKSDYQTD